MSNFYDASERFSSLSQRCRYAIKSSPHPHVIHRSFNIIKKNFPLPEPQTTILGWPDIFVNFGTTINLTCIGLKNFFCLLKKFNSFSRFIFFPFSEKLTRKSFCDVLDAQQRCKLIYLQKLSEAITFIILKAIIC